MDLEQLIASVGRTWDDSIIERLMAYVRIPNKSPDFDPQWEANGHMERAVQLMAEWCRTQPLPGARTEIHRLPGKTPLLLVDVPGELSGSVLLYGHLDKQPEFTGWLPGLSPWEPVMDFAAIREKLQTAQPRSIRVCVLLSKKKRRARELDADYLGFEIEDEFVVGYGLD